MLDRIVKKLKGLVVEAVPYDPSQLGDPVALQTDWGPAKGGGASFATHKLVPIDSFRIEFRPTPGALVFYAIFLVVGVAVLVGFAVLGFTGTAAELTAGTPLALLVPALVGLVFSGGGGMMLYRGSAPIVFDKRRGVYWKGRVAPHELSNSAAHDENAELDRIHALQLISEFCRSDKSSYYSYELNLVLTDGSRINVVDHGNRASLQSDAEALSAFLETPIWDATSA